MMIYTKFKYQQQPRFSFHRKYRLMFELFFEVFLFKGLWFAFSRKTYIELGWFGAIYKVMKFNSPLPILFAIKKKKII